MAVCIIPARGGSQRLPGKNIMPFFGRPIIEFSIEAAKRSKLFSEVYVTTDDQKIEDVAIRAGALVHRRSPSMARDEVGTQEVARGVLLDLGIPSTDYACVLYATSPMVSIERLIDGRMCLADLDADFAMSVGTCPLRDAAQWYWGKVSAFVEMVPLIDVHTMMVPVPENTICDINTIEDWNQALRMYCHLYPTTAVV